MRTAPSYNPPGLPQSNHLPIGHDETRPQLCLRLAKVRGPGSIIMLRLPRSARVGNAFAQRLSGLASHLAFGTPKDTGMGAVDQWLPKVTGPERTYILSIVSYRARVAEFLAGLVKALHQLGLLERARIEVADPGDGVMRQLL